MEGFPSIKQTGILNETGQLLFLECPIHVFDLHFREEDFERPRDI